VTTEATVYDGLTEVFHDVFGDDSLKLTPTLSADQVAGWDSVRMVTIILGVEQHFNIKLRSREVDQLKNVGDLARLVETKLG
jgi:acyl carrier protein